MKMTSPTLDRDSDDAVVLRGVIHDLCDAIERHGVDLSGIGAPYSRIELRKRRAQADELIETLEGHILEARQEYQGARADAESFRHMADTAEQTAEKLRAELAAKHTASATA